MPEYALKSNEDDRLLALLEANNWEGDILCITCSTANSPKTVFCDNCDAELNPMSSTEAKEALQVITAAYDAPPETEQQDQPKKKKIKRTPEKDLMRSATQKYRRARSLGYNSIFDRFLHGKIDGFYYYMCAQGHNEVTMRELDILAATAKHHDSSRLDHRKLLKWDESMACSAFSDTEGHQEASGVEPPHAANAQPNKQKWSAPTRPAVTSPPIAHTAASKAKASNTERWTAQEWRDWERQRNQKERRRW